MGQNSKITLLIIDDDSDLLEVLKEHLQDSVFKIKLAESAKKAWAVLQEDHSIDMVISDVVLPPHEKGQTVLKRCRRRGIDIPFIFVSGGFEPTTILQLLRLGAVDFIKKPFNLEEISNAVGRARLIVNLERELAAFLIEVEPLIGKDRLVKMKNLKRQICMLRAGNVPDLE